MDTTDLSSDGWSHIVTVKDWKGRETLIGQDSDGDIGILDADGYSIIIDPKCVSDVMDWLAAFIKRRNKC